MVSEITLSVVIAVEIQRSSCTAFCGILTLTFLTAVSMPRGVSMNQLTSVWLRADPGFLAVKQQLT